MSIHVPMYDSVLVHVVDSGQDLLHEAHGLLVVDALLLDDILEELAPVGVFHDQVDVLLRLNYLSEWGNTS